MSWLDSLREKARLLLALWTALAADDGTDSAPKDQDYPPEERWWDPETRDARPLELNQICRHCGKRFGRSKVKVCPRCGVVLHAECYEDTEGGNAYATDGCDTCRHRTYWR